MPDRRPSDRPDAHCPDCPYSDRGDFLVYREEWDNLQQELRIARFDAEVPVRELREENGRLRRIIADLVEGETAEEGTPQWYALHNARAVLDA